MNWLNVYKHLLPNARAWRLVIDRKLRQFFDGLTDLPEGVVEHQDHVWNDYRPQKTTKLNEWEDQFALENTGLTEQQRRDRLDATWKALGGQDPRYIQDTLQAAGFDVFVHEWWEPTSRITGGSVNNDDVPVARNPFDYLWDGSSPREFVGCGHDDMYCGGDSAFSNSQVDPPGYPLVNKILEVNVSTIGSGHSLLYSGGISAASGADTTSYTRKQYVIPSDPTKYPYFLYIGGETFPEVATVQGSRRDEFEDLCLKICPTEQWLGILVNYS